MKPTAPLEGVPTHPDAFTRIAIGAFVHGTVPRPAVGTTPHAVVHTQDKLALRYYAPTGPVAQPLPVVLVPSLINKAWILDLEPDRSLVAALAAKGHHVFLVDWGEPGPEDADEDVGYVVEELLHRSVVRACRHVRAERAHLLGYCMGGTVAAVYAALHPERIASFVALNTPVRFSEGGRFRELVAGADFDIDDVVGADGLVPVAVMRPAFNLLDPVGAVTKYGAVEAAAGEPRKFARVMARERWLEENVPMAGAFAREFLRHTYRDDDLLEGGWTVRGRVVSLRNITAPLLLVSCSRDFIAPPAACLPLAEAVGAPVRRVERLDCGHIGVVVGAEGPKQFYPLLDRWFRDPGATSGGTP